MCGTLFAVRILVDYRPALRERTGVGEYVHEMARALAAHEPPDQITLFTNSWKDRPSGQLASEMGPGVRIVDAKVPVRALVWTWNRLEWPAIESFAGPHDVVHSQSPLLIPTRNAAQVVTIHDLDFLRHPDRGTAEIRRDYPVLAKAHAARADAVIVSSQYAAAQVVAQLRLDPSRVHRCPPGPSAWTVDVRRRRQGQGKRHILFIGTLNARKNVGILLDAYARLLAELPNAPPLVLAGHRTPQSAQWEQRCGQPPLAGHVSLTGYVDLPRRIELYEQAIMLVLPSLDEGFGLPVLEAMACGVPVVVSSRGSLPEVAGPAATPVDAEDAAGFAAAMRDLLNPDIAAAAADRAVRQAASFSWTAGAAAVRRAYQSAIEVHRSHGQVNAHRR